MINSKKIIKQLKAFRGFDTYEKNNLLYQSGISSKYKSVQISSFLIHSINPKINLFIFNKHLLAKRFNCSMMIVSRTINKMKKAPHILIKGNTIRLNLSNKKREFQ